MNLFLHSKDAADIRWADTLNNPQLLEGDSLMKFDIVVANPPFSLDKWGAEHAATDVHGRFRRGVPPKSKGDYGFIQHMIETAFPKSGRVGVIVPHGVLFRGGSEGKIRTLLIEENLLDAVVGLPENLFFGTGIPAAILIFDRRRELGGPLADRKDVLFIDASRDFVPGKSQNTLGETQIDKIITIFRERKAIPTLSASVANEQLQQFDYNLNISRYVETLPNEDLIDIVAIQQEIATLDAHLSEVRAKLGVYLKDLSA